jgi:hypothetical protein
MHIAYIDEHPLMVNVDTMPSIKLEPEAEIYDRSAADCFDAVVNPPEAAEPAPDIVGLAVVATAAAAVVTVDDEEEAAVLEDVGGE